MSRSDRSNLTDLADHGAPAADTDEFGGKESVICERCGKAEMYRMHAVWRCPECGYKTDCCGW